MPLSPQEILRYSRHFPVIHMAGQQQLKQAKVLCVGAGGLGSPVLLYLAAAGIGTLGMVDHDVVEISNLQRQVLFDAQDLGLSKALCAQQKLQAQNPLIEIKAHYCRLTQENAEHILADYDLIVDGSDNYLTRYLINDICHVQSKPLVSASIFQFQGQISVFNYNNGPCYRCLYPAPPPAELVPNCAVGGVLGVLPGIIGTLQATEAIKLILKIGQSLSGRLLTVDALTMQFKDYEIRRDPHCPLCQHGQFSHSLFTKTVTEMAITEIEPQQLADWLQQNPESFKLLDVREPYERELCHIGGEHIPLGELHPAQLNWDKQQPLVVYCKMGGRSLKAAQLFQDAGYEKVYSLKGGIVAWAQKIDPEMVIY